jgi:putative ABC transport system permease protein
MHVVGVMADFHYHTLHQRVDPLLILFGEFGDTMVVRLRSQSLSRGLEILHDQWRETYPNHPAMESYFLDQDLEEKYAAEHRLGSVFIAGSFLTILIACLGLLGLVAYMAEQRTMEIGVRKVLGATMTSVILLLSKDFAKLILIALVLGVPISYYIMQGWLEGFPYRTEISLGIFIFTGFAALLITWLTVGYHALKAATANPADALHAE